jgi:hypothetical protein
VPGLEKYTEAPMGTSKYTANFHASMEKLPRPPTFVNNCTAFRRRAALLLLLLDDMLVVLCSFRLLGGGRDSDEKKGFVGLRLRCRGLGGNPHGKSDYDPIGAEEVYWRRGSTGIHPTIQLNEVIPMCRGEPTCQAVCQAARRLWLANDGSGDEDSNSAAAVSTSATGVVVVAGGGGGEPSSSSSSTPASTGVVTMARVESMYRTVLDRNSSVTNDDNDDNDSCRCVCTDAEREAKERLALLLLQKSCSSSGRHHHKQLVAEADRLLASLGYTCRLASNLFNYAALASEPLVEATTTSGTTNSSTTTEPPLSPYCKVFDNVLELEQLRLLQNVFGNIRNSYWTDHSYAVFPTPSPYYSYILPLVISSPSPQQQRQRQGGEPQQQHTDHGILYDIVHRLHDLLRPHFPALRRTGANAARFVEAWAHNRPHATGHQFHFDSDNEGCTDIIRNPIVSCVLYLSGDDDSDNDKNDDIEPGHDAGGGGGGGGPTVVTNQRLSSRQLASQAWLVPATRSNRLVAFDGKLLHGVVPGMGGSNSHRRRVTLMVAFWNKIRVRQTPGSAACQWPAPGIASWADALMTKTTTTTATDAAATTCANGVAGPPQLQPPTTRQQQQQPQSSSGGGGGDNDDGGRNVVVAVREMRPVAVSPVYETIPGGQPWSSKLGVPDYELMFQGM